MPAWALILIQALPSILASIGALIEAIAKGGGTPTPQQAAQLTALWDLHDAMTTMVRPHLVTGSLDA